MLENSVWAQYNEGKLIQEALSNLYACEFYQVLNDEKELYAILKRAMTKKELRLFAMVEGGESVESVCEKLSIEVKDFEQAKFKAYKKIRQNKVQDAVKSTQLKESEN